MRDYYDDEYAAKIKSMAFSCNMVLSMKKTFFGIGVNKYVEDGIIRHLLTCKECRKAYTAYAKEVGYQKFNLITYAIQFCEGNKDYLDSETRKYLREVQENKPLRIYSKPWTRAANNFEIDKLMNMKAFRDLAIEHNAKKDGKDYTGFMKFITLKLAKHIDHLEECLLKEQKENEKSK